MFNRNNFFGSDPKGGRPQDGGYGAPTQAPPRSPYGEYKAPDDPYNSRLSSRPPQSPYGGAPRPSPRGPPAPTSSRGVKMLQTMKAPTDPGSNFVYRNLATVSQMDYPNHREGDNIYLMLNKRFVVTAAVVGQFPQGYIGLSLRQRGWMRVGMGEACETEEYDQFSQGKQAYLGEVTVEVGFATSNITERPYEQEELSKFFIQNFADQVFAPGQKLVMDFKSYILDVTIINVQLGVLGAETPNATVSEDPNSRGILTPQTDLTFIRSPNNPIKLKGSAKKGPVNPIISPNFKFEDMGIGGLDNEFTAIFRRAFASRIFPPALTEKLGIQHVKGLLLYGPPGTGKTLIARRIGQMLNAREPKVINGPEVLNKYVGASEENIRKLFADAEAEYKAKGDESELHIIIFDELDAVCKQRGSGAGGGTGVGDSVVNQLLSKLDGVNQLNNILLIGMTNRKDMIDDALLRPGRLEVHMEISLPDEHGRAQILKIHTAKMKANNVLDDDVEVAELAHLTKNFSGAEIAGLVKAASSFAFNRHIKVGTVAMVSDDIETLKVNRSDFMHALEEVKPAFGVSDDELAIALRGGLIHFSPTIDEILANGKLFVNQLNASKSEALLTVLLHGPHGSGKTALAAKIAQESEYPFIKLLTPEQMVGMGEAAKLQHINKVFADAHKSPQNVLILDNIERIIEWIPIGPRFSNSILNTLMSFLTKQPPNGRRLLLICTSSSPDMLQQLGLYPLFEQDIYVPPVRSAEEVGEILRQAELFEDPADINEALNELRARTGGDDFEVGIKRVLLDIDTTRAAEGNKPVKFAQWVYKNIRKAQRM